MMWFIFWIVFGPAVALFFVPVLFALQDVCVNAYNAWRDK